MHPENVLASYVMCFLIACTLTQYFYMALGTYWLINETGRVKKGLKIDRYILRICIESLLKRKYYLFSHRMPQEISIRSCCCTIPIMDGILNTCSILTYYANFFSNFDIVVGKKNLRCLVIMYYTWSISINLIQ